MVLIIRWQVVRVHDVASYILLLYNIMKFSAKLSTRTCCIYPRFVIKVLYSRFFYIVPCSYFIVYNHIKIQRFMERISEVYIIFAELSYIQFIGKRYYINMHMYANVTRHTCMELFIINTLLIC